MDFGYKLTPWAFGVHTACVVVSVSILPAAFYYGIRIKHRLIYLTPSLCLALAYENLLLAMPTKYLTIEAARTGWVMNALIPPLFLVTCFETGYVVHKHRSVKYLGINFDEGKRVDTTPCSWLLRNLVRLISLAILFMGLVVNFAAWFPVKSDNAGMSGYLGLAYSDNAHYYVSLVPSFVFSIVSIIIGATIARYGAHSTLLIRHSMGWNWMLLGAFIQCAGQFPAQTNIYPATSMLGQTFLLLCIFLSHREVLRDRREAARITEFLRRQKAVQIQLAAQKPPGLNSGGTSPRHHHAHQTHAQRKVSIQAANRGMKQVEVEMVNIGTGGGQHPPPYDDGGGREGEMYHTARASVAGKPSLTEEGRISPPKMTNGHPREEEERGGSSTEMIGVRIHHPPSSSAENCERGEVGGGGVIHNTRLRRGSSSSSTAPSSARRGGAGRGSGAGGGGRPARAGGGGGGGGGGGDEIGMSTSIGGSRSGTARPRGDVAIVRGGEEEGKTTGL